MKPQDMLAELEGVAQALDIKVSYEALASSVGGGGLCRVKGVYRVIIDKRCATGERVSTLAEALSRFDTSALELSADARSLISYYQVRRAS